MSFVGGIYIKMFWPSTEKGRGRGGGGKGVSSPPADKRSALKGKNLFPRGAGDFRLSRSLFKKSTRYNRSPQNYIIEELPLNSRGPDQHTYPRILAYISSQSGLRILTVWLTYPRSLVKIFNSVVCQQRESTVKTRS